MPIYEYTCTSCDHSQDAMRSVADREQGPICEQCGCVMKPIISLGPKPTDHLYPYYEENFQHKPVLIKSLKHYKEEQRKRGLVDGGRPRGVKGQWV